MHKRTASQWSPLGQSCRRWGLFSQPLTPLSSSLSFFLSLRLSISSSMAERGWEMEMEVGLKGGRWRGAWPEYEGDGGGHVAGVWGRPGETKQKAMQKVLCSRVRFAVSSLVLVYGWVVFVSFLLVLFRTLVFLGYLPCRSVHIKFQNLKYGD